MPASMERGDSVLDQRKLKLGIRYVLLPQEACLERWGVSCLRIERGTRASPKAVESHEEELLG